MALAVLQGNKPAILSKEQALAVWEVLQGRREPENDKQAEFVGSIERIYMPYEYAPADYCQMYPDDDAPEEREMSWTR